MNILRPSIKALLLAAIVAVAAATPVVADTYSWQNFQSDIPGVAAHVDPNLVNPWGMATGSDTAPIWVSDNGTGVSTLYMHDGTANSLVVNIPGKDKHKPGNPTGVVFNGTASF